MASLITTTTINTSFLSSSSLPHRLLRNNNIISSFNCLSFQPFSSSTSSPSSSSSSSSTNWSTQITTIQIKYKKNRRGFAVVTRAAPTTTNLIFAFVFPLTLILVTVFTSIRIADKLDQDYLEELAINEAIMKENGNEDTPTTIEEKTAVPRTRNRPKREA